MNRPLRIVLALAVLLVSTYLALAALARPRSPAPVLDGLETPIVFAHQGGDRLWPSNTLFAFERAVELGADVLELDLHTSSDGVLVVIHDDTVDRTTDGSGRVRELTLQEIKQLDAGSRWSPERREEAFPYRGLGLTIPTLDEVFEAFPNVPLNLEIKQTEPPMEEALCNAIREQRRAQSVMVGSFHDSALERFRSVCPEVATSAGPREVRLAFALGRLGLGRLYRPAADALQVPEYQGSLKVVSESLLRTAHRKGVQVHVWTPNETEEMERLLELGVDGIITDRPDRLLGLLDRGYELELPEGVPR